MTKDGRPDAASQRIVWFTMGAFVLVLLSAAASLLFLYRQQQVVAISQSEVRRTRLILDHLQQVMTLIVDAETSERGYVITGNHEFLEPYQTARVQLRPQLETLRGLVRDTAAMDLLIDLEQLAAQQLEYLAEVIAARERQSPPASLGMYAGKQRTDAMRDLVKRLRSMQESRLTARFTQVRQDSARMNLIAQVAVSVGVLVASIAGGLLLRHARRRVAAEHATTLASTLLQSTMGAVTQGVAVFDAEQRLRLWNRRYLDLRGVDQVATLAGMRFMEILQSAARLTVMVDTQEQDTRRDPIPDLSKREPFDVEAVRDDGLMLQISGRPMRDGNYIVTYTDVTALKTSEISLRDQATRLTSILDHVVDAIITINESGSIESWSKGAERLFGYHADEVLRRNVRMLMPEPHSSGHDGYLRRYMQTGERRIMGKRREVQALRKDGSLLPVDLGISEMWIGKRRLFIGIVRDISARLEVERLKNEFVSTVSHELRTPLTSIAGSLGLLSGGVAGAIPPKAQRLIEIARQNCERLVRLINDILDLEKAEADRLDLQFKPQQMKPLVQAIMEENRAFARNFKVTLELSADSIDECVLIDRDRFSQVLTNLLSNAAKFSPRGGVVVVATRREGEELHVDVTDSGPGIAPEFQQRIFQKFAQADSSDARAKGGTGLGLSIARTLSEKMGGRLSFETAVGEGTTFTVSLPLHREIPETGYDEASNVYGPAVLICDDDPDVTAALQAVLVHAGMHVETFSTAHAARARLHARYFDVALIDINLPDMDGMELIAELRADPTLRALPVVVISAQASGLAERIGVLNMADWLQKPIDPKRLLDAIHTVLARIEGRRARILYVEDDASLTQLVRELLHDRADVVAAHSLAAARQCIADTHFDLVILDITLGDGSGLDLLPLIKVHGEHTPVVLYSAAEPSREISALVHAALVKSRDPMDKLLDYVRSLTVRRDSASDATHPSTMT